MSAFFLLTLIALLQPEAPVLRFRGSETAGREVVARLPTDFAKTLPIGRLTQEQGENVLTLSLVSDETKKTGPAMLGRYERSGVDLVFTPRFALTANHTYQATLKLPRAKATTLEYRMPPPPPKSPPRVVKIYPTANVLPANHLKFYIYFDRPMRGGKEIFKQIVLVDDKGKEIEDPWLLDEIWDEENNCLIIFIHPGRIKWGVELRELLGPVLYEKRQYSLVIRGEVCDLDGNKIGKDIIKKFSTTPEDRVRIHLADWRLEPGKAGSRFALTLTSPKSLDHRSLRRFLNVTDDQGNSVTGTMVIGKDEKTWQFVPAQAWQKGTYHLNVDGDLEDVAGNTPLRPFDLDLKAPKLTPQELRLKFQPR
ncbi:MAG: hypothetical protein HYR84_02270 [Planctomycetes bacterium]|nr:hypothetical protein [Planctomycetota bacterium]